MMSIGLTLIPRPAVERLASIVLSATAFACQSPSWARFDTFLAWLSIRRRLGLLSHPPPSLRSFPFTCCVSNSSFIGFRLTFGSSLRHSFFFQDQDHLLSFSSIRTIRIRTTCFSFGRAAKKVELRGRSLAPPGGWREYGYPQAWPCYPRYRGDPTWRAGSISGFRCAGLMPVGLPTRMSPS